MNAPDREKLFEQEKTFLNSEILLNKKISGKSNLSRFYFFSACLLFRRCFSGFEEAAKEIIPKEARKKAWREKCGVKNAA